MESLSLHISGMHCAACVGRVEKALARVPGLQKAEVLLTEQRAELQLQPGWQAQHLLQALEEAGYGAPLSQATLVVDGLLEAAQAQQLEAALRAVPGVLGAQANLAQSSLRLSALPSTPAAALLAAARAAGFTVALQTGEGDPNDPLAAERRAQTRELAMAGAATLPLLLPMLGMLAGSHTLMLPAEAQAVLAGFVLLVPGRRLFSAAWRGLRAGAPGMDLLVSLGASSAFGLSVWLMSQGVSGMSLYFESSAAIVAFVLLGRWLETRAKQATGSAVRALQALLPSTAEVLQNGQWRSLPVAELQPGQRLRVRPGQRVPVDGRVESGRSHINLAHLNGEPLPRSVETGEAVPAGALNLDGLLELTATQTAAASSLGQLVRLVETAQASKPPIQRLADRVAARFVPAVLLLSLLTLLAWGLLSGHWDRGLINAVAVLVVACPCALGLATPTAVVVGIGQAARLGFLVRDAAALEALAGVQRMAFDKTGTLTRGAPELLQVELVDTQMNRLQAQTLAAAIAQGSSHPLSQALRRAQGQLPVPEVKAQRERAGLGAEAQIDGETLLLGSSRLLAELGLSTALYERAATAQGAQGRSVSWLARRSPNPQVLALFAFGDEPRPDAAEALAELQGLGLQLALLSGDRPEAALAMAKRLGLDDEEAVHGGLLPADKLSSLHAWRARGETVAFVGDGLNDAPALAAADVGIAIAPSEGGNDLSRQAASLTLLAPQLARLPQAVRLARATLRNIRQNLGWAFGFNLLMLPLAMAGQLPPALAAGAMAGSSLMVVGNALRLKRWK